MYHTWLMDSQMLLTTPWKTPQSVELMQKCSCNPMWNSILRNHFSIFQLGTTLLTVISNTMDAPDASVLDSDQVNSTTTRYLKFLIPIYTTSLAFLPYYITECQPETQKNQIQSTCPWRFQFECMELFA